jgi:cytochrome c oxidase subunit III
MSVPNWKPAFAREAVTATDAAQLGAPAGGSLSLHPGSAVSNGQLAVLALLATAGMLFAGFASAYLVRREGTDWNREPLPTILIFTTIVLLSSSATIEISRSALRRGERTLALLWAATTTLLGLAFLVGQLDAWQQLAARGLYLSSGPYSSFFYVLTAMHGLHLCGGIVVLAYLVWRISRSRGDRGVIDVFRNCATYWHFVGGVWLLLYLLLRLY